MGIRMIRSMATSVALVLAHSGTTLAQNVPVVDSAGGFSILHDTEFDLFYPRGWSASAAVNITRLIAVIGEVSRHDIDASKDLLAPARQSAVLFGARVRRDWSRAGVYVQGLFGSGKFSSDGEGGFPVFSDSQTVFQAAAGVDIKLAASVGIRAETATRHSTDDVSGTIPLWGGFFGVVVGIGQR